VQGVWRDFLKYGRMDDSDPPTVNVKCSPQVWPTTDDKVDAARV
jgi:hypothetical protein